MSEDKKTCFIIMPITTPESFLERYDNDKDHFIHVLEYLHMPAVKSAGYEPISPNAQGSDLIHAEIIKNLESADLVLCDISTLNPNVFFELGIRTSLNKPVCYVKDEYIKKIPFDTGIFNHKEYHSTIKAWDLKDDVPMIAEHLQTSFERSNNENTLWRHFGIRTEAKAYERKTGTEGKIDEILFRLDTLQNKVGSLESESNVIRTEQIVGTGTFLDSESNVDEHNLLVKIIKSAVPKSVKMPFFRIGEKGDIFLKFRDELKPETVKIIGNKISHRFNRNVHIIDGFDQKVQHF